MSIWHQLDASTFAMWVPNGLVIKSTYPNADSESICFVPMSYEVSWEFLEKRGRHERLDQLSGGRHE
jgi:hypothetical protein